MLQKKNFLKNEDFLNNTQPPREPHVSSSPGFLLTNTNTHTHSFEEILTLPSHLF